MAAVWRNSPFTVIAFTLLAAILLWFVLLGQTVGSIAQQMHLQYPWRGVIAEHSATIRMGYPSTDFGDSFFPNWDFLTTSIQQGVLPLWLPYDFGGSRAMETGLPGLYYPIRLLLSLFFPTIVQHSVILFTHLVVALVGMYALLRRLGCSTSGATYGAIVWSLNGHVIFYISFQFVLIYAAFLPIALLAATNAVEKKSASWAAASGLSMGLMSYGGYANYTYVSAGILIAWYLYWLARNRLDRNYRMFLLPIISAAIATLVGSAYWMPFLDVFGEVVRRPKTLDEQIHTAIPIVQALRGLVWPQSMNGPIWSPLDFPSLLFSGPYTVFLWLAALWHPSKNKRWLLIGLVSSFLFIVGFRPIYMLGHTLVPWFGALHPFSNGAYMFSFFGAILSAYGLTVIDRGANVIGQRWNICTLRYGSMALVGTLVISSGMLLGESQPIQPIDSQWLFPPTPITVKLIDLQEKTRSRVVPVLNVHTGQLVFFGRSHAMLGVKSVFGYESLPTLQQYAIVSTIINPDVVPDLEQQNTTILCPVLASNQVPVRRLGNLAVRYIVSPPGATIASWDTEMPLRLIYDGEDGRIWENPGSTPRAFVAHHVDTVPTEREALRRTLDPDFDPRTASVIYLAGNARPNEILNPLGSEDSAVQFQYDGTNAVELQVWSKTQSLLVLQDTWAPSWRAYVNGERATVFQANFAHRGVVVPAGDSEVRFVYRPMALILGLILTMVSLFAISIYFIALWVTELKNRNQHAEGSTDHAFSHQ